MIATQIKQLINNSPLVDNVDINLKFLTDRNLFERAVTEAYGRFITQKELKQQVRILFYK